MSYTAENKMKQLKIKKRKNIKQDTKIEMKMKKKEGISPFNSEKRYLISN